MDTQYFEVVIFWASLDSLRFHFGWKGSCFMLRFTIHVVFTQNISGHRDEPEVLDQLWF